MGLELLIELLEEFLGFDRRRRRRLCLTAQFDKFFSQPSEDFFSHQKSKSARRLESYISEWTDSTLGSLSRFTLESRKVYRWLFSEKREPEISNHFRDRTTEKEFGGETYNTEGHDNHEQKKNHSAEFCHQVDRPSLGDGDDVSTAECYAPAGK